MIVYNHFCRKFYVVIQSDDKSAVTSDDFLQ